MGTLTAYHRKYYKDKRRAEFIEALGGKCVKCGATERLEIDHIDRELKELNISKNLTLSNTEVLSELAKCQLLCYSCHKKKTVKEATGFTHGTMYGWMKSKCDCELCVEQKRKFHTERNKARRVGKEKGPYSKDPPHGTTARYCRKCRCDLCRKANAERAARTRREKAMPS